MWWKEKEFDFYQSTDIIGLWHANNISVQPKFSILAVETLDLFTLLSHAFPHARRLLEWSTINEKYPGILIPPCSIFIEQSSDFFLSARAQHITWYKANRGPPFTLADSIGYLHLLRYLNLQMIDCLQAELSPSQSSQIAIHVCC